MGFVRGAKNLITGVDTSGLKASPREQLDPETQANLNRSIESAQSLRRAPLISQGYAGMASDEGIRQQARAMGGASPAKTHAVMQQGAGLGAQIVGKYGQPMAQESVDKYAEGLRVAQAGQLLSQGQVLHALAERIKNYLVTEGINISQSQALTMAGSTALAYGASLFDEKGQQPDNSGSYRNNPNSRMGDFPTTSSGQNWAVG